MRGNKARNNQRAGINKAASNQVARDLSSRNAPINKKVDRVVRSELNRVMKDFKGNIKDHIKIKTHQTPQAQKFLKLMDDPFNADWADAKYPYYPGGQPNKSTIMRAFGVTEFTTTSGTSTQIYFCPNPGAVSSSVGDTQACLVNVAGASNKSVIGAPPFQTANANGAGLSTGASAGFIKHGITTSTTTVFQPQVAVGDQYIAWNTASVLGEDAPDKPGLFSYRLVAAAIRLTPTSKELDLGGVVMSCRISEKTNVGYSGNSIMAANSSAHWTRGSNSIEMKYMRSSADDTWYYPSVSTNAALASTETTGVRHFITIQPPDNLGTQSFILQAIGFYEIKGSSANKIGTDSFQQPSSAGTISSAISIVSNQATDAGSEKKEFEKAVELVNAKESPATGELASGAPNHKSLIDKIEDFVGMVAPVAEKAVKSVAPLLTLL